MGGQPVNREIPRQPSKSAIRRNPHLYGAVVNPEYAKNHPDVAFMTHEGTFTKAPPKRIRQSTKPLLNKLESEWLDHMRSEFPMKVFHPQCVRFKLGNGIWYKPDFMCFNWSAVPSCWEIKGPHAFRGGFENLKVAAHAYPSIAWHLIWKDNGQWKEQTVLP